METIITLPKTPFKGTFKDFLAFAKEYPASCESAHSRFSRLWMNKGVNDARTVQVQNLFGDTNLQAFNATRNFYGTERALHEMAVKYLAPAAMGGETSKQACVQIGPPSSGKSDLDNTLKGLFRNAEPVPFLAQSRVRDNPLNLLYMIPTVAADKADAEGPEDFEARVAEIKLEILESLGLRNLVELNSRVKKILRDAGLAESFDSIAKLTTEDLVSAVVYGLGMPKSTRSVVFAPEPMVQDLVRGLKVKKGQAIAIAEYPIDSFRFSSDFEGSVGIVDVSEVNPINFDISEWIGAENLAMMGRVDPDDPRSVQLNGAFNKGNRGIVILTEGLKNPPEAQRILLEALQGRRVRLPNPLGGSVGFDGVVIINSNESEYNKFVNVRENEPYLDRFYRIWFPYPVEKSQARRVIEKIWGSSEYAKPETEGGVHVDPDVFDYLAHLEILTRIEKHPSVPMNMKVEAYDGRDLRAKGMGMKLTVHDLREAASAREGLEGMSPRETAKIINSVAAEVKGKGNTVTSRLVRERLREWFKANVVDEKKREFLMGLVASELDQVRHKTLRDIVLASLIESFPAECESTWQKYLDNIRAFALNQSVKSQAGYSRGPVGGDETFMREIETDPDWGVTLSEAPKFRAEVLAAVNQHLTEKRSAVVPYTCHEAVRRCIERHVLKKVRSGARLFSTANARTDEDRRKINDAKTRLVKQYGFSEWSAEELLREAEENSDFLLER
jgi:serine protein kinase